MNESFDAVIVGGRCAGAPLATMLARDGLRVCLVDKDRFPSDTPSTHGIQPIGVESPARAPRPARPHLADLAGVEIRPDPAFADTVVDFHAKPPIRATRNPGANDVPSPRRRGTT
jgi:flavin-dependent dehydrogenase